MGNEHNRTPERTLILGSTAFAGIDSVNWTDQVIPNIPDYDLVVVSVPHITEDFLKSVKSGYLEGLRKAFVRFLDSGGNIVALISETINVDRPSKYPERVSSSDWCPIIYVTAQEVGKSIVVKQEAYKKYLDKMSDWSFYIAIAQSCLSREITEFYGSTYNKKYKVPLEPYLENRYGRVLAGHFHVEIRVEKIRTNKFGNTYSEYSEDPDFTTGSVVLLPLIGKDSPEEALAEILCEEIGLSLKSPEPDWAQGIEMPGISELAQQVEETRLKIHRETEKVQELEVKTAEIYSYRRLLFATGSELEIIVKKSLERLGATVLPSKYSQEEYILEFEGQEFLMEVKGVAKSIALSHIRQLNDYLLKYQEDTGKECKGILFANAWRNVPPEMRGQEDTQVFPDNVIRRAEQWGISLIPSTDFFNVFIKALENPQLAKGILEKITSASGVTIF
jgi:hypothetical protein